MRDLQLWIRVGDQGDYHSFDSVDEAAEFLHEHLHNHDDDECIGHEVNRYQGPGLVGIEIEEFLGDNGVSFYWGEEDAGRYCSISDDELEIVRRSLNEKGE